MAENVKGVKSVKRDNMSIRVVIPKSTYRALKVKCTLLDISVKKGISDLVEKWVKGVKRDIEDIKAKV